MPNTLPENTPDTRTDRSLEDQPGHGTDVDFRVRQEALEPTTKAGAHSDLKGAKHPKAPTLPAARGTRHLLNCSCWSIFEMLTGLLPALAVFALPRLGAPRDSALSQIRANAAEHDGGPTPILPPREDRGRRPKATSPLTARRRHRQHSRPSPTYTPTTSPGVVAAAPADRHPHERTDRGTNVLHRSCVQRRRRYAHHRH